MPGSACDLPDERSGSWSVRVRRPSFTGLGSWKPRAVSRCEGPLNQHRLNLREAIAVSAAGGSVPVTDEERWPASRSLAHHHAHVQQNGSRDSDGLHRGLGRPGGYRRPMERERTGAIRAVLIDIDGVLTVSWEPLPGAVEAMERLRAAGLPLALVTNTTSRTRASICSRLVEAGFPVTVDDILTAPAVTAVYLREHHPDARCLLLNAGDINDDLTGVTLVEQEDDADPLTETDVDVVVVGGAGDEFGYEALNRLFHHLQRGAHLVAMHRNLYWRTADGLDLDTGAFLLGLERAARVEASITGKPSEAFFAAALAHLGADASATLMVGDDIESDVLAAQRSGITGALVKTGKYLPETHRSAEGTPDHVLDCFAALPDLLERLASGSR